MPFPGAVGGTGLALFFAKTVNPKMCSPEKRLLAILMALFLFLYFFNEFFYKLHTIQKETSHYFDRIVLGFHFDLHRKEEVLP